LFGVVVAVLLRDATQPEADDDADTQADRAVGYRQAFADRVLLRFLLMTVTAEFVYIQSTVALPLHVTGVGLTATDFGLLIGLNGLLVLVLELPITGWIARYKPEHVLAIGNLIVGIGLALTGLMTDMLLLAATVLIWSLGEMMTSTLSQAYLGSLSPSHLVGRYQGLHGVAYTIGTGAGPLVGGAVYALGPWALWVLIGLVGLLSAQLSLPSRRAKSKVDEPSSLP